MGVAEEGEPAAALVFKTIADPFVGKITMFRVYSGHRSIPDTNATRARWSAWDRCSCSRASSRSR